MKILIMQFSPIYRHFISLRTNYSPQRPVTLLLWLYSPLLGLGRFFSFLIFYTVGRTPWTGGQSFASPLPTHRITQTE
jgi:hypothetical protein